MATPRHLQQLIGALPRLHHGCGDGHHVVAQPSASTELQQCQGLLENQKSMAGTSVVLYGGVYVVNKIIWLLYVMWC